MSGKRGQARRITRRRLFEATAGAGLALPLAGITGNVSAAAPKNRNDLGAEENAREGTREWMLTRALVDQENRRRSSRIEGYASKPSARPGETIELKVSTRPASPFTIDIYRTGYYQGRGGRHMTRLGRFEGTPQEEPPVGEARLRECQWETSAELTIPADWLSGVYLAKLTAEKAGAQS